MISGDAINGCLAQSPEKRPSSAAIVDELGVTLSLAAQSYFRNATGANF